MPCGWVASGTAKPLWKKKLVVISYLLHLVKEQMKEKVKACSMCRKL